MSPFDLPHEERDPKNCTIVTKRRRVKHGLRNSESVEAQHHKPPFCGKSGQQTAVIDELWIHRLVNMSKLYLPAHLVEYKVPGPVKDLSLATLLVRKETDHEFMEKLRDDYLNKIYSMQLRHEISQHSMKKLSVRMAFITISFGLVNRIKFAIKQKMRLKSNVGHFRSQRLWEALVNEVDSELEATIRISTHFVECDKHLEKKLYEASRVFKEDISGLYKNVVANE